MTTRAVRFILTITAVFALAPGLAGCEGNDNAQRAVSDNAWTYEVHEHDVQHGPLPSIPIFVSGEQVGIGNLVVLHHRAGDEESWPAVWCLYSSGYMRLVPATDPPTSFGISGILGPAYWADGEYQHNPTLGEIRITGDLQRGERLQVTALGSIGRLAVSYDLTVHAPTPDVIRCDVVQTARCIESFLLDVDRMNLHEGYKLAQFSSMYIDGHYHDVDMARYVASDGIRKASLAEIAVGEEGSLLFAAPTPMAKPRFDFVHDSPPGWQGNTPTMSLTLSDRILAPSCTPQGWFQPTDNENDDNVGGWINWNAAPIQWQAGDAHTVEYEFAAHAVTP